MESKRYMIRIDRDIEEFIKCMPGDSYVKKINAILRVGITTIDFGLKQKNTHKLITEEQPIS